MLLALAQSTYSKAKPTHDTTAIPGGGIIAVGFQAC